MCDVDFRIHFFKKVKLYGFYCLPLLFQIELQCFILKGSRDNIIKFP